LFRLYFKAFFDLPTSEIRSITSIFIICRRFRAGWKKAPGSGFSSLSPRWKDAINPALNLNWLFLLFHLSFLQAKRGFYVCFLCL
jgi:hypothetical protein